MSAHDFLWPARPEYLRVGTPIVRRERLGWCSGPARVHHAGSATIAVTMRADKMYQAVSWVVQITDGDNVFELMLDLRDVTARAHAAMAWTVVTDDLPLVLVRVTGDDRDRGHDDDDARRIIETLHRMRMMDETVTVAQAREALGWAERVAGVAS